MTKNLNLFNTLSRKKEKFVPIDYNKIGMYVCGPTVYDFPHIGNARPLVVFDVLFRLLKTIYGKVPAYSVVVPGSMPSKNNPDGPSLYCVIIVKKVDEKTRSKTSINDLLRD